MSTTAHAPFPVKSGARNACVYPIQFTTNTASDPDGLVDPAGIVDSVALSATGIVLVTLSQRFLYINAHAEHQDDTTDIYCKVVACTQGYAAANTVTVEIEDGGTDANSTDKRVTLTLVCWR